MINDDNACIRYLMKEMDPSEEVLMERAMMENDDLLIEVECLRQTLKRLDKLPEVDPPAHLSESIIRQAAEHRKNKLSSSRFLPAINLKYAAAALVVIGSTVGSFMFYGSDTSTPAENPEEFTSVQKAESGPAEVAGNVQTLPVSDKTVEDNPPAPWVDRNDIIHFKDHYGGGDNTAFQSLIKSSTEKLTPLNDSFIYSSGSRSLQLTSSGANR